MPYYSKVTKFCLEQVRNRIFNAIYEKVAELNIKAWVTPEPVPYEERQKGEEKTLKIGDKWGNLWDCAWFHFTGVVPESLKGKKVVLLIDINGEACIVDENGCPLQGLTNVNSDFDYSLGRPGKRVVPVAERAKGGEIIDIWADAGCNDLFGKYKGNGTIKEAHIAICNEEMRKLYYDFEVLYELMQQLPEDKARHQRILNALNEASMELKNYTEEEAARARSILAVELNKKGGDPSLTISAIGHAHIDLAWLWPIRETIRKGARTFSTALMMMDKYPDYVFGASQPQLYVWIKERYPQLYEKIKKRVAEGRWEPQGAMWVEADTNISGEEALVRQILYGKRFFRSEFNKDIKILWLPDVFGYTGSLPQILKKSGVDYFSTIKLSWSIFNQHPHHTFYWQGIDGSKVLVHMPPEGTYNSSAAPRAIAKAEKEYLDKSVSDNCLLVFGIGDGGGGPGEEHLEYLLREKNLDGIAPVKQEPTIDFFKKLEKNASRYKTWTGELYLERHQGTYTTQARNKRYNRKMEIALRDLEFIAGLAHVLLGYRYPQEEIERIWKEVLLYQFHDILPGSSITRVYNESLERYEILLNKVKELTEEACKAIAGAVDIKASSDPFIVFNTLSWERSDWIKLDGKWIKVILPPMGYMVVDACAETRIEQILSASDKALENDLLRVEFSEDGTIISIYDKENQKEVIPEGCRANRLAVYEDIGDAWDFPINYDEKAPDFFKLVSAKGYIDGPEAILEHEYVYGESRLSQKVILTAGSRRIDFVTKVDWRESGKMLRTSFPVNVFADETTCNIQFGSIKRPTHRNTSWDMAKYEICAHKWVDMSQRDYGVALLNDCKYGHKVYENILDLNLLRSSSYPDPIADRAEHHFTYSLYPHAGDHVAGEVMKMGYELNTPLKAIRVDTKGRQGVLSDVKSFIKVDKDSVIIEAVKKAEDDEDLIVRLYESTGSGVKARIYFDFAVKEVKLVNLLEEHLADVDVKNNSVELEFKPFEIHTLKVKAL
ncbi:alpha-mannosidase [Caldanaerobius fijiensis DSM 17918]|uniref:Alpha-mannosidase n=1 Tax=Caldanaerobius fijiensis DSM 17918 TaxID=1121256 RepID=A0A1M4T9V3_9THEO|nr:glycoside hydrolase family 38 C-terminal domain-containing protein [Caldanaerobius fijiensis]SHE41180.1 alpha-mannosidase [Caldanaerobius fijiensis DSM 17918]